MAQIQQGSQEKGEGLMIPPEEVLKVEFSKGLVSPRVLLDKLRMIDEDSRKSSQYQDPFYLPFYYHLSKVCKPRTVASVGFDLGLHLCCFLQGCSSAERAVCLQRPSGSFYSPRMGLSNIKAVRGRSLGVDFHLGDVSDRDFLDKIPQGLDLVMITDKASVDVVHDAIEIMWSKLNLDGLMSVEYVTSNSKLKDVFKSFCNAKSRDSHFFQTRYGTGLVWK